VRLASVSIRDGEPASSWEDRLTILSIVGNKVIELLGDEERFCYHRAATMKPSLVQEWLGRMRSKRYIGHGMNYRFC
jgi:hypothetical protein